MFVLAFELCLYEGAVFVGSMLLLHVRVCWLRFSVLFSVFVFVFQEKIETATQIFIYCFLEGAMRGERAREGMLSEYVAFIPSRGIRTAVPFWGHCV